MKNIIEVLGHEHQQVQRVVEVMSGLARNIEAGQEFEPALLGDIVQFMRIFGERCHHVKEEKALFSLLERKGVPANGCPIGVLITEHRRSHALLDLLEKAFAKYRAGDKSARLELPGLLSSLIDLYRQHIWKEEYLLFPMATKVLEATDYEVLSAQFEAIESSIGVDVHHGMETLVAVMEQQENESEDDSLQVPECSVCGS
jgi:hemerythrin-like domain-containing protein